MGVIKKLSEIQNDTENTLAKNHKLVSCSSLLSLVSLASLLPLVPSLSSLCLSISWPCLSQLMGSIGCICLGSPQRPLSAIPMVGAESGFNSSCFPHFLCLKSCRRSDCRTLSWALILQPTGHCPAAAWSAESCAMLI